MNENWDENVFIFYWNVIIYKKIEWSIVFVEEYDEKQRVKWNDKKTHFTNNDFPCCSAIDRRQLAIWAFVFTCKYINKWCNVNAEKW